MRASASHERFTESPIACALADHGEGLPGEGGEHEFAIVAVGARRRTMPPALWIARRVPATISGGEQSQPSARAVVHVRGSAG